MRANVVDNDYENFSAEVGKKKYRGTELETNPTKFHNCNCPTRSVETKLNIELFYTMLLTVFFILKVGTTSNLYSKPTQSLALGPHLFQKLKKNSKVFHYLNKRSQNSTKVSQNYRMIIDFF